MPIYDYNGTSNTEIGKLYDYNGSSNTQIGKVYDYNGTSSTLIYSAEETSTLSGAWSDVSAEYTMKWKTISVGSGWTSATIDTSSASGNGILFCGIGTSASITSNEAAAYNGVTGYVWGKKWVNGTQTGDSTSTVSLNSGTTYYLYVGVYYATDHTGEVTITATVS